MKKLFLKISLIYIISGLSIFILSPIILSFSNISEIIYNLLPLLSRLIYIWIILSLCFVIYWFKEGIILKKIILPLAGIGHPKSNDRQDIKTLYAAFSFLMFVLLFLGVMSFTSIGVYTAYKCAPRKSGTKIDISNKRCVMEKGSLKILYFPRLDLPSFKAPSKTETKVSKNMVYFTAKTNVLNGKINQFSPALFLLVILITRFFSMARKNGRYGNTETDYK